MSRIISFIHVMSLTGTACWWMSGFCIIPGESVLNLKLFFFSNGFFTPEIVSQ